MREGTGCSLCIRIPVLTVMVLVVTMMGMMLGNNSKVDHDAGGGDGGDGPNDDGNATHDDPHKRGHVAGDN